MSRLCTDIVTESGGLTGNGFSQLAFNMHPRVQDIFYYSKSFMLPVHPAVADTNFKVNGLNPSFRPVKLFSHVGFMSVYADVGEGAVHCVFYFTSHRKRFKYLARVE